MPPTERTGIEFLTVDDVAAELSVGVEVVRALIREGDLPALTRSGKYCIERLMFEHWIRHQYEHTRRFLVTHPHAAGGGSLWRA